MFCEEFCKVMTHGILGVLDTKLCFLDKGVVAYGPNGPQSRALNVEWTDTKEVWHFFVRGSKAADILTEAKNLKRRYLGHRS